MASTGKDARFPHLCYVDPLNDRYLQGSQIPLETFAHKLISSCMLLLIEITNNELPDVPICMLRRIRLRMIQRCSYMPNAASFGKLFYSCIYIIRRVVCKQRRWRSIAI
ncbi:hypothetical protein PUN28_020922 [Cardiocondyla obscurior]|uniref:Uncharacterized protein n=1 Tax=Cardiocondyla obscurior TaxID=286306 RepID=A0AAW2EBD8_9HYME